ncbi:helix-turn-helix transcriptional regulator [Taibaiella koreensis]|uniref:helix-turn-helix transcriptional regulator n=1 Tax=Taibaiella koreensis TaxID=1268548 RepID=UPI000E59A7E7|nr:YafY family protein [Taibaiella koreensis]
MPAEEKTRLARLTAILLLLQSGRLVTAAYVAQRFEISIRTVYRDIRALEAAGVPVLAEEGKGYRLMEGYTLPPVMFTETEANALITAEQLIRTNRDASLVRDYTEAVTRVKAVLRQQVRSRSALLAERTVFRQNPAAERTSSHLSALQLALTHFQVVGLRYKAEGPDAPEERIVEPFALYSTQENWILVAWCRLRNAFRSFRLDRIHTLHPLQEHFAPHALTLAQYFDICRENAQHP